MRNVKKGILTVLLALYIAAPMIAGQLDTPQPGDYDFIGPLPTAEHQEN
ncbi:hypothetical protein [Virgibacillus halodenitrificans]|nr:hypothetical protein [Virgibacillus halodenitrificans]